MQIIHDLLTSAILQASRIVASFALESPCKLQRTASCGPTGTQPEALKVLHQTVNCVGIHNLGLESHLDPVSLL